jgi:hypothetical protein
VLYTDNVTSIHSGGFLYESGSELSEVSRNFLLSIQQVILVRRNGGGGGGINSNLALIVNL